MKSFFPTENVGRLKKLEYLNLALNNVERIENLEGKYSAIWHIYGFGIQMYFLVQLSFTGVLLMAGLGYYTCVTLNVNPCSNLAAQGTVCC